MVLHGDLANEFTPIAQDNLSGGIVLGSVYAEELTGHADDGVKCGAPAWAGGVGVE
jgi:hypothetical protein